MKPYQEYVRALLSNPEFIKQVYYGNGERMTMVNLAKVIHNLDVAMDERFDKPGTNGTGWDSKSGPHGNGSKACQKACVCAACDIGSSEE